MGSHRSVALLACALFAVSGAGASICPNIISRAEWGAREATESPANLTVFPAPYIVVHHGGTSDYCFDEEACAVIMRKYQNYHMDYLGVGDIGYNFVIGEDGNVYEGRGWDVAGAHARGYNQESIGIAVIGDFSERVPNCAALEAMERLMLCGVAKGHLSLHFRIIGHNQATGANSPGAAFYALIQQFLKWTDSPQSCSAGVCPAPPTNPVEAVCSAQWV